MQHSFKKEKETEFLSFLIKLSSQRQFWATLNCDYFHKLQAFCRVAKQVEHSDSHPNSPAADTGHNDTL